MVGSRIAKGPLFIDLSPQSGGVALAGVGPLPTVLVALIFGVIFFVLAVFIFFMKVSEVRLQIYSVVFWIFLVLQQYIMFAVQINHTASSSVNDNS